MRRLSSINIERKRKKIKEEMEIKNYPVFYCVNKYFKNKSSYPPIFYINDIHLYRNDIIRRFSFKYSFDFYFDWKYYFNLEDLILEGVVFHFKFIENIRLKSLTLKNIERIYYFNEIVEIDTIHYKNIDMEYIHRINTNTLICDNIKNFKFQKYFTTLQFLSLRNNNIIFDEAFSYIKKNIFCEIKEIDYHYYYKNNILIADNIFLTYPYRNLKFLKVKNCKGVEIYDLIEMNRYIEYLSLDNIIIVKSKIGLIGKLRYLKYLGLQNNSIDIFSLCLLLREIKTTLRYLNLSNIILPYDFLQSLKKIVKNCKVLYNENKEIYIK